MDSRGAWAETANISAWYVANLDTMHNVVVTGTNDAIHAGRWGTSRLLANIIPTA